MTENTITPAEKKLAAVVEDLFLNHGMSAADIYDHLQNRGIEAGPTVQNIIFAVECALIVLGEMS